MDIPIEQPTSAFIYECTKIVSSHFNVSPYVILAIIETEGGKVGTISKNKNNTADFGLMQINSIHLKDLKKRFDLTWQDITYKPCLNITAGAWLLSKKINETDNYWLGVGNYHSKTPSLRYKYLLKLQKNYTHILKKYLIDEETKK